MQDLKAAITPKTSLVSIMAVNNEIGVLQPLREIGMMSLCMNDDDDGSHGNCTRMQVKFVVRTRCSFILMLHR